MGRKALTTDENKKRIARGRNYERLYRDLKPKYDQALTRINELEALLTKQAETMQTQTARIEQLEAMVFGKKSKLPRQPKLRLVSKRDSPTYRRPLPPASAITATKRYDTSNCHRCGHELTNKAAVIHYEEDIELAVLTPKLPTKRVTKQVVEQGWCSRCGQLSSAIDVRGQKVTLGPVVRSYIVYLVCQLDLSYAQVTDLLLQQYKLAVSNGELTGILEERRRRYLPLFEQLKERVRAGPVHMDETSYPIQSEKGAGQAWTMTSSNATEVVYRLADSRGKGHALELLGSGFRAIGITDRYGVYKRIFEPGKHQICWAHLARNARDIAALECLDEVTRQHCQQFYQALSQIYASLRKSWQEPFDQDQREDQSKRLLQLVVPLCQLSKLDPKQLADLKTGILDYQECLFVCLMNPDVPPDNNKAERSLRKLVLKRKKSFGVKTTKGARTMEVLYSVCQSLYNQDKNNLLINLHRSAIV
jgi:transposase